MTPPDILFRDARFVVLNKPAGLAVHAGPSGGPSVEDFFPQLSRRRTGPWLAHRLDADTAGCLVVALTKTALLEAQACFAGARACKTYWAVVQGDPGPHGDAGTARAPLMKVSSTSGWRMVVDEHGQDAVTDWLVLRRRENLALMELRPRTGRTHQIRVHCAMLGFPILGDPIYGGGGANGPKLHLFAREITLPLTPVLTATAPDPPHMAQALALFGD